MLAAVVSVALGWAVMSAFGLPGLAVLLLLYGLLRAILKALLTHIGDPDDALVIERATPHRSPRGSAASSSCQPPQPPRQPS